MSDRLPDGTFAPGHKMGYTPSKTKSALLRAIKDEYSDEVLLGMIREAWLTASGQVNERHRSAKTMTTIIELLMNYILGKPKQSFEIGTDDSRQLLAAYLSDRTPLLPPRQGVIEVDDVPARLLSVDTTIVDANENAGEMPDD